MKAFNTLALRSMDCFCVTDFRPQSAFVKMGMGAPPFSSAATHCFFYVEDETGLCWNVGMGTVESPYISGVGLEMTSLKGCINNGIFGIKIVRVIRHPCWDDEPARIAASKFLVWAAKCQEWNLLTRDKVLIRYDWAAFFGYLDSKHRVFTQDKKKAICSEVPDAVARRFCNTSYTLIPSDAPRPPSPWDVEKSCWPSVNNYLKEEDDVDFTGSISNLEDVERKEI